MKTGLRRPWRLDRNHLVEDDACEADINGATYAGHLYAFSGPTYMQGLEVELVLPLDNLSLDDFFGRVLEVRSSTQVLKVTVLSVGTNLHGTAWELDVHVVELKDIAPTPVTHVYAPIMNSPLRSRGPAYAKTLHATIECGPWLVRVERYGRGKRRRHWEEAVTDCVTISRLDGKPFPVAKLGQITRALHLWLTFLCGSHVGPGAYFGVSEAGDVTWSNLQHETIDRPSFVDSWLPQIDKRPTELLSTVFELLSKEGNDVWLSVLIDNYVDALRRSSFASSLLIAQSGLELIGHRMMVDVAGVFHKDTWERLKMPEKLRLMLYSAQVSYGLTSDLKGLIPKEEEKRIIDAAEFCVWVRNCMAHPSSSKLSQHGKNLRLAIAEAWEQSVRFLELLILFSLDYRGGYRDRVHPLATNTVYTMVPWAQPPP